MKKRFERQVNQLLSPNASKYRSCETFLGNTCRLIRISEIASPLISVSFIHCFISHDLLLKPVRCDCIYSTFRFISFYVFFAMLCLYSTQCCCDPLYPAPIITVPSYSVVFSSPGLLIGKDQYQQERGQDFCCLVPPKYPNPREQSGSIACWTDSVMTKAGMQKERQSLLI